jgi:hypothetical protein
MIQVRNDHQLEGHIRRQKSPSAGQGRQERPRRVIPDDQSVPWLTRTLIGKSHVSLPDPSWQGPLETIFLVQKRFDDQPEVQRTNAAEAGSKDDQ